jgi:hypothetical protein
VSRIAAATLAALAALAWPAAGAAATGEEVRALAERAASNPAALAELREIEVVDGRRVDLEAALAGAEGDALRARLTLIDRAVEA